MKTRYCVSALATAALLSMACRTEQPKLAPAEEAPAPAAVKVQAPDKFIAVFKTTQGDFAIEVHRDWAPHGADRFYRLVKEGYYDGVPFFRAIDGFMVQFGISSDPELNAKWREDRIPDDPPAGQSNRRGFVSFATSGPNSRTTQVFINFGDNSRLDGMGFTPFGVVLRGQNVVDSFYKGYGEGAPRGRGPDQGRLQAEGDAYWRKEFPKLDSVKKAFIE